MLNKTSDITLALNTLIEKGYKINEDGSIAPPRPCEAERRRENAELARAARKAQTDAARAIRLPIIKAIREYNPTVTQRALSEVFGVSKTTINRDINIFS
jgi:uncharacterized membrane protein